MMKKFLLVFLTAFFLLTPSAASADIRCGGVNCPGIPAGTDCKDTYDPNSGGVTTKTCPAAPAADDDEAAPPAGGAASNTDGFRFNIKQPGNSGVVVGPDIGTTLGNVFQNMITIIFVIAILIFLFMILIGAMQWILSGGNKESVASARSRITHALIGLVILALAFLLVTVFGTIVGINIINENFTIPTLNSDPNTTTVPEEPAAEEDSQDNP